MSVFTATNLDRKMACPKKNSLYIKYGDREWILDDESYFTKTFSTINGNDNFYSDKIDFAPA